MIILGINAYHANAAAAIVVDGQFVAAVEEERLNRVKYAAGLPVRAIRYCLDRSWRKTFRSGSHRSPARSVGALGHKAALRRAHAVVRARSRPSDRQLCRNSRGIAGAFETDPSTILGSISPRRAPPSPISRAHFLFRHSIGQPCSPRTDWATSQVPCAAWAKDQKSARLAK